MTYCNIATPVDLIDTIQMHKFEVAADLPASVILYNTDLMGHSVVGLYPDDFVFTPDERIEAFRGRADVYRARYGCTDDDARICADFLRAAHQAHLLSPDDEAAENRMSGFALTLTELTNKRFMLVVTSKNMTQVYAPDVDDAPAFEAWSRKQGRALIVQHHNMVAAEAALQAHGEALSAAGKFTHLPTQPTGPWSR